MNRTRGWRRAASAVIVGAALLAGGAGSAEAQTGVDGGKPTLPQCGTSGVEFVGFSDALNKTTFAGTNVGGLSALDYNRQQHVFYSLVDNERDTPARLYTLALPIEPERIGTPQVLTVTTLRNAAGQPFTGQTFDGEGLALTRGNEVLISSENEPSIRRFRLDGSLVAELPVPERFRVAPAGQATNNQTFESLALSPYGRSLFTAVEGPLAPDGQTEDGRSRIRILEYTTRRNNEFVPSAQYFYLAEPGQGVVEIVAVSERKLLVLERGFVVGQGNTVRVFQINLAGAPNIADEPSLATTSRSAIAKTLLVDLATCPPSGATTPGTQANPLLDNFEGLALGPRLGGGRQSLILQSDDNFNPTQVTRLVVLAVRLP